MLSQFLTVSYLVNKIRKLNINNEFSKVLNYGLKEKILKNSSLENLNFIIMKNKIHFFTFKNSNFKLQKTFNYTC